MPRPRLNFENEEQRRQYQREYAQNYMRQRCEQRNNAQREEAKSPRNGDQQIQHREYARNYMRQRRQQMTNVEREEERNHRNQLDRQRHVKRRATMTLEEIEEEMRQHANEMRAHCT